MKNALKTSFYGLRFWWLLIPFVLGAILLIVGSFVDLNLSKAIVDQSSGWGIFWEGWGMLLCFLIVTIGAAALGSGLFQLEKKVWKVLGIAMLVIGIGAMVYYTGHFLLEPFTGNEWLHNMGKGGKILAYVIGVVLMVPTGVGCFFLFKRQDAAKLIRIGLLIVLWVALQAGILEIVKRACYRPRFRWLFGDTYDATGALVHAPGERADLFRAWFENWQWFSKKAYSDPANPITYAADSDYIKSWPSGHTGMATIFLAVPLLFPLFGMKEEKYRMIQPICFVLCGVLFLSVAYARIRVGAHWLSDVGASMVIALLIPLIFLPIDRKIVQKRNLE